MVKLLRRKIVGILKESSTTNMFNALSTPGIICPTKPYYSTYFGSNAGTILKRVVAYTVLLAEATDTKHVQDAQNQILNYLDSGGSDASQYKDQNSDFVVITQQYILDPYRTSRRVLSGPISQRSRLSPYLLVRLELPILCLPR